MVAVSTHKQDLSRFGIGASEIASVAGLNPYASPWDIYLRKIGQTPDIEQNEPMEWGHRLEPAIRQKYADETNAVIYVPPASLFHPEHFFARATPDGVVLDTNLIEPWRGGGYRWLALVQCKNVGHWVEKAWSDAPPAYVQLQEQWEMLVTETDRADVAVLIGGNDFRTYTIHRDNKVIADLVTIGSAFWKRVESRTPPPVDDSEACKKHFEQRFAKKDAVEIVADEQLDGLFADWRRLTSDHKAMERQIETIRNVVRQHLAEAQADRIVSTYGTAKLSKPSTPEPSAETDWRLVAQLIGTRIDPTEFKEITKANTKIVTGTAKAPTLYAPKNWAKEQA